jgi:DNA-directed RNA polymerase subunit K/omega
MTDEFVTAVPEEAVEAPPPVGPTAAPIRSRFLFVDVAAQRAKQLRRGARVRIDSIEPGHKLERVAMREVSANYVEWALPSFKGAPADPPRE